MKYSQISLKGKGLVAVIVLALVVGAGATLFVLGMSKDSKDAVSVNGNGLCEGVIANYNSAFTQTSIEGHASKLAESAKSAAAISDNQTDANCVYIQFTNAAYTKNVDDTTKFANLLQSLSNEDKYITGQLANPLGIEAIKQNAATVTSPDNIDSTSSIKGNG